MIWYEEYLIFNKVSYIPDGAGFLNHQQYLSVKNRCFPRVWQLGNAVTSGSFFIYRGSTLRVFTVFVSTLLQIWANLDHLDFTRNWNIRNEEIPYSWGPCYMKFLLRWPHLASWKFGMYPWCTNWHPSVLVGRSWVQTSIAFDAGITQCCVCNKLANITYPCSSPSSQHPILHLKASNPPLENWAFLNYHWFPYQPHYSCQLTHQEINRPIHARCKVLYWCKRWEVQSGIKACCLVYHGCNP